jgi:hypothetical protein
MFLLRLIKGTPWLRGYCRGPKHVWDPEERFLYGDVAGETRSSAPDYAMESDTPVVPR